MAPRACTIGQLYIGGLITTQTDAGPSSATITLYDGVGGNALVATPLTCTIGAIENAIGATASCSDTVHTVSVFAGETLSLQVQRPGSPNGAGNPTLQQTVHMVCQ